MRRFAPLLLLLPLTGCVGAVVGAATAVVTAPVKAAGWTADKLTTSQSEADEKRGRAERKAEEKRGRALRKQQAKARKQQKADLDDRT